MAKSLGINIGGLLLSFAIYTCAVTVFAPLLTFLLILIPVLLCGIFGIIWGMLWRNQPLHIWTALISGALPVLFFDIRVFLAICNGFQLWSVPLFQFLSDINTSILPLSLLTYEVAFLITSLLCKKRRNNA